MVTVQFNYSTRNRRPRIGNVSQPVTTWLVSRQIRDISNGTSHWLNNINYWLTQMLLQPKSPTFELSFQYSSHYARNSTGTMHLPRLQFQSTTGDVMVTWRHTLAEQNLKFFEILYFNLADSKKVIPSGGIFIMVKRCDIYFIANNIRDILQRGDKCRSPLRNKEIDSSFAHVSIIDDSYWTASHLNRSIAIGRKRTNNNDYRK